MFFQVQIFYSLHWVHHVVTKENKILLVDRVDFLDQLSRKIRNSPFFCPLESRLSGSLEYETPFSCNIFVRSVGILLDVGFPMLEAVGEIRGF